MQTEYLAGFWEHVDELRSTLLRTCVVIGVGFLCLLTFYQPLLHFLATCPIERIEKGLIKQRIQMIQILNSTVQNQVFELPAHAWMPEGQKDKVVSLAPGQTFLYQEAIQSPLLIMGPVEGLLLVFKICFWLSVALTAPLWGWIWLQFILPGLKNQEKALLIPFLLGSLICLGMGFAFAYFVTLPIANQYLFLFNSAIGQNAWTLSHYVNYVLLLYLGHAVAAELALLLLMLVHFRFLSVDRLIAKRRYMIVLAFIIGALLTPPDVFSQLLLAIPLMGLYEIAIWYAKWLKRSNSLDRF